jgi:hypothetical protein
LKTIHSYISAWKPYIPVWFSSWDIWKWVWFSCWGNIWTGMVFIRMGMVFMLRYVNGYGGNLWMGMVFMLSYMNGFHAETVCEWGMGFF